METGGLLNFSPRVGRCWEMSPESEASADAEVEVEFVMTGNIGAAVAFLSDIQYRYLVASSGELKCLWDDYLNLTIVWVVRDAAVCVFSENRRDARQWEIWAL